MREKTHLHVTRYSGDGVFIEDSHGNEQLFTADKYGCYNVDTADGQVEIAVIPEGRYKNHGNQAFHIFAPISVKILREELA